MAIALLAFAAAPAAADEPAAPAEPTWVLVPYSALVEARTHGTNNLAPDDATKLAIAETGLEVTGTFRMCIAKDGSVRSTGTIRETGYPGYDEMILEQIGTWRFLSDGVDAHGRPICSDVSVSYPPLKIDSKLIDPAPDAPAPDDTDTIPASAIPRRAAADEPRVRAHGFLLRGGIDFGGEDLAREIGGGDRISAGGLVTGAAGVFYHPPKSYTIEATLGYKTDRRSRSDGTLEFRRFPLDVIVSYTIAGHRFGGGPTLHLAPFFQCDVCVGGEVSTSMDTAVGVIAQYAYGLSRGNRGYDFGARYTRISYSADGYPSDVDGSSFGLFVGGWL